MAKIFAYIALLLVLVFATTRAEVEKDGEVLIFTDKNFDDEIQKHNKILVEFYAPWCGHCKKLAPEYVKAAEILAKEDPPVYLAKVDATEEKELADRYEIQGFPTLKWIVNQKAVEYNGGRTAEEIVSWIKKRTGPPSQEVSDSDLKTLKLKDKIVVAFFGDKESTEYKAFQEAATEDDKTTYVHNLAIDATLPEGAKRPVIVLYRQFDEPFVLFDGKYASEEILNFVSKSSIPTLIEFHEDYIKPIFQDQKDAIFLMVNKKDNNKLFSTFEEAAKEQKGKLLFVHSGITEGIQQRLAEFLGVTAADMPRLVVITFNSGNVDKFVYSGDLNSLTTQDVAKFIDQFKAGELKKFLKSEDIPTNNDEPVRVVVGKNFHDIVGKESDVLLEFYAPWCGHCKALEPKYKELATELKDVKGLIIAKWDATANEIDGIDIQGFPTIRFFKKGSTESEEYEGDREVDGFKKFLLEKSEAYKNSVEKKEDL